jgi:hypothetical protein
MPAVVERDTTAGTAGGVGAKSRLSCLEEQFVSVGAT